MTRYYFDLYNDEVTADEEGVEFPDLEAARASAIREVRSLAAASIMEHSHLMLGHKVVIREGDQEVGSVTFGEVVTVRG